MRAFSSISGAVAVGIGTMIGFLMLSAKEWAFYFLALYSELPFWVDVLLVGVLFVSFGGVLTIVPSGGIRSAGVASVAFLVIAMFSIFSVGIRETPTVMLLMTNLFYLGAFWLGFFLSTKRKKR